MRRRQWLFILGIGVLMIWVFPLIIKADVGNSFSGGSSGGGYSGGYSGGSSFSGGSGLGGLVFLGGGGSFSTIIVVLIIFAIYSYMKAKNGGGLHSRSAIYRNSAPRRICDEATAIRAVQAVDPNFSAESFKTFASEVYLTLQEAWEDRDWKKVRPFESNTLFNVHNRQLQEYIDQHKTNHLDMQNVRDVTIAEYRQDGALEILSVKLEASLLDYVSDDESGRVLEGSKTQYQHRFYYLEFIRKAGVKTTVESEQNVTNCPNCGAPTEVTSSGECAYCHSIITNGDFGWVLNKYMAW